MARKDRPIRRLYITKDLQLLGEIEEITVYPLIGGGTQLGSNEPYYENKTVLSSRWVSEQVWSSPLLPFY